MKILIINLHSSSNAGDAALAAVSVEQLKTEFPESTITLSMNDPASHIGVEPVVSSFFVWLKESRWYWLTMPQLLLTSLVAVLTYRLFNKPIFLPVSRCHENLLRAYFDSDIVVSCPGNILQTLGRFGLPLLMSVYAMVYAWLAGKPLYMLPQSVGPLKRSWERGLVRWILSKFRIVMVRELVSYNELIKMKVDMKHCYLMPDMAFIFSAASKEMAIEFLQKIGLNCETTRPLLGVTLINWGAQNRNFHKQVEYEMVISTVLQTFIEQYHGYVIIFSQVLGPTPDQDDRVPARRVLAQLSKFGDHIKVVEETVTPQLLKSIYGMMDIFIGTRMHSNIFALGEGVPVLAIGYLYKTQGIMDMLQLSEWVLDINQLTVENLISKLESIWTQREAIKTKIFQINTTIVEQLDQPIKLIAIDFRSLQRNIK